MTSNPVFIPIAHPMLKPALQWFDLCLTSDLWRLVVHRDDGDVEDKVGDGSTMVVADGEDKLEKQWIWADVLYWRHEGHLPVVHCVLQEHNNTSIIYSFELKQIQFPNHPTL